MSDYLTNLAERNLPGENASMATFTPRLPSRFEGGNEPLRENPTEIISPDDESDSPAFPSLPRFAPERDENFSARSSDPQRNLPDSSNLVVSPPSSAPTISPVSTITQTQLNTSGSQNTVLPRSEPAPMREPIEFVPMREGGDSEPMPGHTTEKSSAISPVQRDIPAPTLPVSRDKSNLENSTISVLNIPAENDNPSALRPGTSDVVGEDVPMVTPRSEPTVTAAPAPVSMVPVSAQPELPLSPFANVAPPVVHISIGRIEVRARTESAPPPTTRTNTTPAIVTLDEYLRSQTRSRRGNQP